MPSADQHRRKAESNRRFLASISLDDFPDWVVVAAFYTAVHVVERLPEIERYVEERLRSHPGALS
jgi:hypothetical protein